MPNDMDRDFWDEVMASSWIEDAVLHHAGAVSDGRTAFLDQSVKVLAIENNRLVPDGRGGTASGMIFYLARTADPKIGDRLTYRDRLYDLAVIQVCKDLDGAVTAYRCSTV